MTKTLLLVGLTLLPLGVAGCAPARSNAAPASVPAASAGGPDSGVIVAIRPLAAPSRAILVALNESAAASGRTAPAMEFIIRDAGGRTISVVQADTDSFRPGERVALTGGARSRISRAVSPI